MPFNMYFSLLFLEIVKYTLKLKWVDFCNQLHECWIFFFHLVLLNKKHTLLIRAQWQFNAIIPLATSLLLLKKKKKGSKAVLTCKLVWKYKTSSINCEQIVVNS